MPRKVRASILQMTDNVAIVRTASRIAHRVYLFHKLLRGNGDTHLLRLRKSQIMPLSLPSEVHDRIPSRIQYPTPPRHEYCSLMLFKTKMPSGQLLGSP